MGRLCIYIYLPGNFHLKSSTKCLGKYTINGSYMGKYLATMVDLRSPSKWACINCINGLYTGVILTTSRPGTLQAGVLQNSQ